MGLRLRQGRLSDRFGRKPLMMVSIVGTMMGFVLVATSNALWVLFAARLLDGFTGSNTSLAQAWATSERYSPRRAHTSRPSLRTLPAVSWLASWLRW